MAASLPPDPKRVRTTDGVEEPESTPAVDSEQLPHSHAKSKLKRDLINSSSDARQQDGATGVSVSTQTEKMTYEDVNSIAEHLLSRTKIRPEIGIICGSGLGGLVEDLDKDRDRDELPYKDVPNFPVTTVKGHKGNLIFGYLSGHPVVCMQGRFHYYEGHPQWKITMPVRVMKLLGVKLLIVTNAAGGLNQEYNMGDIMIVKDHINLVGMSGTNPLLGENEDRFGPRFPAMTTAYDRDLRKLALQASVDLNMSSFVREGVYVHISGPNYETPSESVFLRNIGADAVGMSTAPEVTVARHSEIKVLGLSLITNIVILEHDSDKPQPNHKEVMESANMRAKDMQKLVKYVIEKMPPA